MRDYHPIKYTRYVITHPVEYYSHIIDAWYRADNAEAWEEADAGVADHQGPEGTAGAPAHFRRDPPEVHGGTFGNESLLKKTTAERQLQRLRKRKESTSNTTAQQSRRMDTSTQTIVRLTLVASHLELKTPSYKLLLIVKNRAVKTLFIELLGRQAEKVPYILKVDERNYFGADLSHILRIKKLKKCHIIKVDERNYFAADLSHILRIKERILLGREEPYIEKKIIVNLLGRELNNWGIITNEYKNKFMNKEEENSYSENESNSSEEETDKTNTTKTQVELNKNIEVEKLVEISINTKEDSDSTQRINKEKTKEKSLLDTTVREDSSTGVEQRILGLRSTPNLVHTELGPVKRKQRVKMSSVKATIEQVTAMIPICTEAKDVCSFIRACDYACEAVDRETIPLLVKFINTRITGKALEVCRYRETSDWETIKKILRGAFEQQLSPQTLQIGLNSVRMKNDEDVLTYTGRVEQLYYNLCNATLANKTPEEARILRQTLKDQALAIYINGLQMDLQTILRARNPETFLCIMMVQGQSPYTIEEFKNETSIFYENQGEIRIIGAHWELVTYIPLSDYDLRHYQLELEIKNMDEHCKGNMTDHEMCSSTTMC
ncbi:hypothetical protein AGLY_018330 [Aphis glycines]|uniref:Retrotransposon gag domain-containing protein n=1 Tax=Aphis glycines TaxID=307491 RepID=A0A6G0SUD8_APHGL|nr:hypothetical protein AGLY_018330 [Aphis glycines]